jgi:AraC family transcriptional regulator of adaptative response/methylated-DNA-[protein]-cysteine methyltransferase
MNYFTQLSADYQRVEQAIHFLEENTLHQPDLAEVASHVGLSEYNFQRLFTRWAGISPKRFLQFLTKENAKALLSDCSILSTTYETGLSGPARLHDLFVHCEAVTPTEYRTKGAGVEIVYGFHPTPFGECLLALTERGICFLAFVDDDRQSALEQLNLAWVNSQLQEDPSRTLPVVELIFGSHLTPLQSDLQTPGIRLHLRGTNFQLKVWEALIRLPPGTATFYEALARQIDAPHSAPGGW